VQSLYYQHFKIKISVFRRLQGSEYADFWFVILILSNNIFMRLSH